MTAVTFVIPGRPYAKKRHRTTRGGRAYNPAENEAFETTVGFIARPHFNAPLTGPVRVQIAATFLPPESWSKRKTAEHLHRPHIHKPDVDNVQKAVMDGLNRIAWADDSQVCEITCRKVWGITAQTVVTVEAME